MSGNAKHQCNNGFGGGKDKGTRKNKLNRKNFVLKTSSTKKEEKKKRRRRRKLCRL